MTSIAPALTAELPPFAPTRTAQNKFEIRGLVGACAGNLVEYYDYFVYAYTAIYFAPAFFPSGDQTSQLLATAGIFAIGFFMRPLGGWLFGWIADTRGRIISMIISILMMSAGSLLITLLPPYQKIGVAAPLLLLAARMLQGFSLGAEFGPTATYISEVAIPGRRGFLASFQYLTIIAGQVLALLIISSLQLTLSAEDLKAWGWRIPFFIGALSAVVVLYLRRSMTESATEEHMRSKEAGSISGLLKHKRATALGLVFTAFGTLYYYTFASYMQKFLVVSAGMSPKNVSIVMIASLICFMICQPISGLLADRIGVRANMLLSTGLAALLVAPILFALKSVTSPYVAFGLLASGLLIVSFYSGISGLLKADLFPPEIRALGVGLPHAFAIATFGGTAEYVALWMRSSGIETYFFFYVAAVAAIAFVAAAVMPNLRAHGFLDGDGGVEDNTGLKRIWRQGSPRS